MPEIASTKMCWIDGYGLVTLVEVKFHAGDWVMYEGRADSVESGVVTLLARRSKAGSGNPWWKAAIDQVLSFIPSYH